VSRMKSYNNPFSSRDNGAFTTGVGTQMLIESIPSHDSIHNVPIVLTVNAELVWATAWALFRE
jgi:hypothetical protein